MLRGAAIFIILLFTHTLSAEPGTIDSLERVLKRTPGDTNRVHVLNELANRYLAYKPEMAKQYANDALELAKALRFTKGEMVALNRLGELEFRQSNYAKAVEITTLSLRMAEQIHDSSGMAMSYRVLGNIHTFGFKQYDLALQYQLSALKIYERRKDKRNIASFYGNITWIYANTNQNLPEAHRLADLGVHLSDSLGDQQLLSYNYNSKGLIFLQEGQLDSALTYLNKSILTAEQIQDRAVIAYDKSIKGQVYLRQENFKKAIEMFDNAASESRTLKIREVLKESYGGLAQGYKGLGNYPLAYQNHLLYTQLKDSLVNWETTQRVLLAKLEFDQQKREAKITELELTNQQARKEKIVYGVLFGVGFLSMITVIYLAIRNNRQRAEINHLLEEKNAEIAAQNLKLREANDIKDKLFSIIGHDLRSPLVSLRGLLSMVIQNEVTDEEFKSLAPKINQHVMGVGETLENLLHWSHSQMKGWTHQPTTLRLRTSIDKSAALFHETAAEKKITVVNEVSDDVTVYADENQLELIFRNLIHNAIKFTTDGGKVYVLTTGKSDGMLEVHVTDTGMGMAPDLVSQLFTRHITKTTRGTHGERGTGLGLLLCKEMAENNGGKIAATSEAGKGSTIHVFLKTAE